MKVSEYFLTFPYYVTWHTQKLFKAGAPTIDFYIGEVMDYYVMLGVIKRMPQARIVAKNFKVRRELKEKNIDSILWPTFPDVVIMARHALHEYPIKNVLKIGMNHGPYIFKDMIKAKKYNAFRYFFMSSQEEVDLGVKAGVVSGVTVGYPKLDPAFNGDITPGQLRNLGTQLKLDPSKKNILFSATWDKSGMSAIHMWYNRLEPLKERYNILVTLHPFMSESYRKAIEANKSVVYIKDANNIPYLMLADVLVSDTSSIIAEFCSLDKPIVTFKVNTGKRLKKEIVDLISSVSISIESFGQLEPALEEALTNDRLQPQRAIANQRFFSSLDGKASERAAKMISDVIAEHLQ